MRKAPNVLDMQESRESPLAPHENVVPSASAKTRVAERVVKAL